MNTTAAIERLRALEPELSPQQSLSLLGAPPERIEQLLLVVDQEDRLRLYAGEGAGDGLELREIALAGDELPQINAKERHPKLRLVLAEGAPHFFRIEPDQLERLEALLDAYLPATLSALRALEAKLQSALERPNLQEAQGHLKALIKQAPETLKEAYQHLQQATDLLLNGRNSEAYFWLAHESLQSHPLEESLFLLVASRLQNAEDLILAAEAWDYVDSPEAANQKRNCLEDGELSEEDERELSRRAIEYLQGRLERHRDKPRLKALLALEYLDLDEKAKAFKYAHEVYAARAQFELRDNAPLLLFESLCEPELAPEGAEEEFTSEQKDELYRDFVTRHRGRSDLNTITLEVLARDAISKQELEHAHDAIFALTLNAESPDLQSEYKNTLLCLELMLDISPVAAAAWLLIDENPQVEIKDQLIHWLADKLVDGNELTIAALILSLDDCVDSIDRADELLEKLDISERELHLAAPSTLCDRLKSCDKDCAKVRFARACALYYSQRHEDALAELDSEPLKHPAWYLLKAHVLIATAAPIAEALDAVDEGQALDPDYLDLQLLEASITEDPEDALLLCEELREVAPYNTQLLELMRERLRELGRHDQLIEVISLLFELAVDEESRRELATEWAKVLEDQGKPSRAQHIRMRYLRSSMPELELASLHDHGAKKKELIKYGLIALVIALLLILFLK